MEDNTSLIVPINVLALVVTEQKQTQDFAGIDTNFRPLSENNKPYLGKYFSRSVREKPLHTLEKGIHLQWELPKALTTLSKGEDGLSKFPIAPNRWLVNRFCINDNKIERSSWIVMSDIITQPDLLKSQEHMDRVTLPIKNDSQYSWVYCGKNEPLNSWNDITDSNTAFFSQLKQNFTAIASGKATFSSFYPSCRNIFGFVDHLADENFPASANLMYTVTGWHNKKEHDILYELVSKNANNDKQEVDIQKRIKESIEENFAWQFEEDLPQAKTYRSIYHGSVQNITWDKTKDFFVSKPIGENTVIREIDADIAIGNSPQEAVVKYATRNQTHTNFTNLKLTDYLLAVNPPSSDGWRGNVDSLLEIRFLSLFSSIKPDDIYIIENKIDNKNQNNTSSDNTIYVSEKISESLIELNFYNQAISLLQKCVENEKWQLFSDWYRIFYKENSQFKSTVGGKADDVEKMSKLWNAVKQEFEIKKSNLQKSLEDCNSPEMQLNLKIIAAPEYLEPTDLAFMLAGQNLPTTSRYGRFPPNRARANGTALPGYEVQKTLPDKLMCRLKGSCIKKVRISPKFPLQEMKLVCTIDDIKERFPNCLIPINELDKFPEPYRDLLSELILESLILNAKALSMAFSVGQVVSIAYEDIQFALNKPYRDIIAKIESDADSDNKVKPIPRRDYIEVYPTNDPSKKAGLPSLIAVGEWGEVNGKTKERENQFVPIFVDWEITFEPIFSTNNDARYLPNFIKRNFINSRAIWPLFGNTDKDMSEIILKQNFPLREFGQTNLDQKYSGLSILSDDTISSITRKISSFYDNSDDNNFKKDLEYYWTELVDNNAIAQSFSGLNHQFLMQDSDLQFQIGVSETSANEDKSLASKVSKIVGSTPAYSPNPDSFYNPIRSGFIKKINFTLVDIFGQKKKIKEAKPRIAPSLVSEWTIYSEENRDVRNRHIAYLPPRICQPARLLFRLLSSKANDITEMNIISSATPVCGWILFNPINRSLHVHNVQGTFLGSIFVKEGLKDGVKKKELEFDAAPGISDPNANQIDLIEDEIDAVMRHDDFTFKNFVKNLAKSTVEHFEQFINAIHNMDSHNASFDTDILHKNPSLALYRPLAIVRASLALELMGNPIYDQSYQYDGHNHDFTGVEFPVMLGDEQARNDGVVGYYKYVQGQCDWNHFYTYGVGRKPDKIEKDYDYNSSDAASQENNDKAVQWPLYGSLTVRPYVKNADFIEKNIKNPSESEAQKQILGAIRSETIQSAQILLMVVDPRLPMSAITGFLPARKITLPTTAYEHTLKTMGLTFFTAAILSEQRKVNEQTNLPQQTELSKQHSLTLPLPIELAYRWTWTQVIREKTEPKRLKWQSNNEVETGMPPGLWSYTPQKLMDGWLKINPSLLLFEILDEKHKRAEFHENEKNSFLIKISNQYTRAIEFMPRLDKPSHIDMYFGNQSDKNKNLMPFSAENWKFERKSSECRGECWRAIPTAPIRLESGSHFIIHVRDLHITTDISSVMIYFKYKHIINMNDGYFQYYIHSKL